LSDVIIIIIIIIIIIHELIPVAVKLGLLK